MERLTKSPDSESNIAIESIRAGWGHIITAMALAQNLRDSELFLPHPQATQFFNYLSLIHAAGQERDSYGEVSRTTAEKIRESLVNFNPLTRLMLKIIGSYLETAMTKKEKTFIEKILAKYPMLAIAFFQLAIHGYSFFGDPIARNLLEQEGEKMSVTTHGITLGPRTGLNIILDPGFPFKDADFSPQNLLSMIPAKGIHFVPSEFIVRVLGEYFGLKGYFLGTVGQIMEPEEVGDKWRDIKSPIILASTSGNAANLDVLLKIKTDYYQYHQQNKEVKRNYKVVIFLGEHPDEKSNLIPQITSETEVYWVRGDEDLKELEERLREGDSGLIVVRTSNEILTAKAKLLLQRLAHLEVVKPGEASFMNQHTATINYFVRPAGPNESMNGIWSGVVYRNGIFMPNQGWEERIEELLKRGIHYLLDNLEGEELYAFSSTYIWKLLDLTRKLKEYSNVFDQIGYLFDNNLAKKLAIESYCQAKCILLPLRYLLKKLEEELGVLTNLTGRKRQKRLRKMIIAILKEMVNRGVVDKIFTDEEKRRREKLQFIH